MTENERICTIWGEPHTAVVRQDRPLSPERVDSPRAGGEYEIASGGSAEVEITLLKPPEKARLTTWLIDQRSRGVDCPEVTAEIVESVRRKPPLPAHERADRLLRYLAERSETVGSTIDIYRDASLANKVREFIERRDSGIAPDAESILNLSDGAAAWSESPTLDEVHYFLDFLKERGWLSVDHVGYNPLERFGMGISGVTVLVDGYSRIGEDATNLDSSQAFVAMWFDPSMDEIYDKGFCPAIKQAGYKALRIDRKPHLNKIDDEVIADIRRSRFVVADFTHGASGARGSVYFEAGFAFGLDIPVIYTCREDMLKKLHFDTRQYPHIGWETDKMDEFRTELQNRIEALIGRGPNRPA